MILKDLLNESLNSIIYGITIIDVKESKTYNDFRFPRVLLKRKVNSFYIVNYHLTIRIY